jgi:hypothetical protein
VSGRRSRVVVRSSAVALALVLAAPSAALADDDHGSKGGEKAKGTSADAGHNPPGNNGTIKIDYAAPADSGHANRPHPGCAFQLRMFGFDDDQYGTVTFVGQAPTKLGTLLTQSHVLLSDDDAGGGQDVDAVYAYTAEQLGLTGTPQAKQGWHVKVSVDADDAPGGAKHKVFWLSCPPAPADTSSGTTGTTTGAATNSTSTQAGTVSTTSVSTTAAAAESAVTTSSASTATESAVSSAGQLAGNGRAATGFTGGAATAATADDDGSALPFTGFGLGTALLLALAALGAGGLAIAAGRRRTALSAD